MAGIYYSLSSCSRNAGLVVTLHTTHNTQHNQISYTTHNTQHTTQSD